MGASALLSLVVSHAPDWPEGYVLTLGAASITAQYTIFYYKVEISITCFSINK